MPSPTGTRRIGLAGGAAALTLLPLTFAEATVYKLGLVLIVVVGAIGLHVLVNWTGELSLAHATIIGFPAFVVAKLSADHALSPLYLLPVGVLAGAAVGASSRFSMAMPVISWRPRPAGPPGPRRMGP